MSINQEFDLIFSIGEACSCSETLRKCRLQFFSYPFDWLFGSTFLDRIKLFCLDIDNFINIDDLEYAYEEKSLLCKAYRNKYTDITFNHDFPKDLSLEHSFTEVKSKYNRRIKRLVQHIEQSKRVLVVYIQTPNNQSVLSKEEILDGYKILNDKYGDKINLLYLFSDSNYQYNDKFIVDLNENVTCIKFDYNAYNKDIPYAVNKKLLIALFNKIKITGKFMTTKNKFRRFVYKFTLFFKGDLWKRY